MRKFTKRGLTTKGFTKGVVLSLLLSLGASSGSNLYANTLTEIQTNKDAITYSCSLYAQFLDKINLTTIEVLNDYENKKLTALDGYYLSEQLVKEINSVSNSLCDNTNKTDIKVIEVSELLKDTLDDLSKSFLVKALKR